MDTRPNMTLDDDRMYNFNNQPVEQYAPVVSAIRKSACSETPFVWSAVDLIPQSHQTSSHYVRTGWPPEDFEQVQNSGHPSPSMMFVACS